jgi:hypothetical protein
MLIGFIDYVVERPPVAKVDPAVYDYYVGRYQVAPGLVLSVIRDGARILGQAPMQPKVELLPASETRFFAREAEIEVTFVRDGKGEVSEAVIDFGGRSLRAKKIKDVDTGGN